MFIVLQIEKHPDSMVEDVHGPFLTFDKAVEWADKKEDKYFHYRTMELVNPNE